MLTPGGERDWAVGLGGVGVQVCRTIGKWAVETIDRRGPCGRQGSVALTAMSRTGRRNWSDSVEPFDRRKIRTTSPI
jgi:hypothetical protein